MRSVCASRRLFLRSGGYKGWKVRHVKGLSVLAKGYKYTVPPNMW